MCQVIHVEDLQVETRELLEENAGDDIVTIVDAEQCEENWEQSVGESSNDADCLNLHGQFVA